MELVGSIKEREFENHIGLVVFGQARLVIEGIDVLQQTINKLWLIIWQIYRDLFSILEWQSATIRSGIEYT
jgi:hypothetical protein